MFGGLGDKVEMGTQGAGGVLQEKGAGPWAGRGKALLRVMSEGPPVLSLCSLGLSPGEWSLHSQMHQCPPLCRVGLPCAWASVQGAVL